MRLWHLPTAACLATLALGGPPAERAVRQLGWLPPRAGSREQAVLVAVSGGGDLVFWHVALPRQGHLGIGVGSSSAEAGGAEPSGQAGDGALSGASCQLAARMRAAHLPRGCVTALCVDPPRRRLWTGDSSGHVAAWDVAGLMAGGGLGSSSGQPLAVGGATALGSTADAEQLELSPGSPREVKGAVESSAGLAGQQSPSAPPSSTLPRRLAHWRAAKSAVVSLAVLPAAACGGPPLLLVGAQEAAVGVWTQQARRT